MGNLRSYFRLLISLLLTSAFCVAEKPILAGSQGTKKQQKAPRFQVEILDAIAQLDVASPCAEEERPHLLVFTLTKGFRHGSIRTGSLAFELLAQQTQLFEVTVTDDIHAFEPDRIQQYDAICFLNTTGELFLPHTKKGRTTVKASLTPEEEAQWAETDRRLKDSLMSHLKSGKGFMGVHAATDTFYDWHEYGEMIGAYFTGHPWNSNTEVNIIVPEESRENPLVEFLPVDGLTFPEEIYEYKDSTITGEPEIMHQLDPHRNSFQKSKRPEEKNAPISWMKDHDNIRVFYSSLGHNHAMYYHPQVLQHYLNGILWVLHLSDSAE